MESHDRSFNRGFPLIELMATVSIVGVLLTIAIPRFAGLIMRASEGATKGNLAAIRTALNVYYAATGGRWPNQLTYNPISSNLPPDQEGWGGTVHPDFIGYIGSRLPRNYISVGHGAPYGCWNDMDPDTGLHAQEGLPMHYHDTAGWFYNRVSHRVYVNIHGTDSQGDNYVNW